MAEPTSPTNASSFVPENQSKWVLYSSDAMCLARNLSRDMHTALRKNEIAEAASKNASLEEAQREKEAAKAKVYNQAKCHEQVISTSFKCMQDIEDCILQTEDSISKVTHERYKGFASLQVCERRQELRTKRPPAETFQDALTHALAAEKSLLEAQRKELFDLQAQGKEIIKDMESARGFLSRDTGERRVAMNHDISSLKPQISAPGPSPKTPRNDDNQVPDSNEAPASPKAAEAASQKSPEEKAAEQAAALAEANKKAAQEQKAAEAASQKLIGETLALLDRCAKHREKCLALVQKCRTERERALLKTEDCMARRTSELAEIKRNLEKHVLDIEASILKAERALDRTGKRLNPNEKEKVAKYNADKQLLDKLRLVREQLSEDVRHKFAALEIDNMCRRVTAAKASESKLKEATLSRSTSAPGLRKKDPKSPSASTMGETNTVEGGESMESTRPPSAKDKEKAAQLSPGGSKSLKAAGAAQAQ
eukprot:TRINITY_DN17968_c1_g1_i1.p1 TRINITY_DN17968_c1_g1~~TRINITY_DN17968_c1_g1_i1.p1  ORF type:complete len:483 (-),score=143.24 TRINITY_DN17968_c1_g1_i1:540-1988(-)